MSETDAPRIEMWELGRLHPYANNPRDNEAAVPKVAESIATFGFKVPIVVRPDGEILAGHTRFKAALRLGLKEVPVLVADDLDDMKAKAFRLADNKVSDLAIWNTKALMEELETIGEECFTGFDVGEIFDGVLDEKDNETLDKNEKGVYYKLTLKTANRELAERILKDFKEAEGLDENGITGGGIR